MSTIHDERYIVLINGLRRLREGERIRQADLAERLGKRQSYVSKVEGLERRLDVVELYDWLVALDQDPLGFLRSVEWFADPGGSDA